MRIAGRKTFHTATALIVSMNIPLPDQSLITANVAHALEEDISTGDLTADLIPENVNSIASVICRDKAILSGTPWFNEVFRQIDKNIEIEWLCNDGDNIQRNATLCTLNGNARSLLSGERAALNFVQLFSATATLTQQYVYAIQGTRAKILDTRKTIPGLRHGQKYAVLCGGGSNHRIGLFDMILIKENHIMAAGSISRAIQQARKLHPGIKVEVETENLNEFKEASEAGADIIMLDNYTLADMQEAVDLNDKLNRKNGNIIKLEASGGVTFETVRDIAETGVDFISIGQITKDIKAVDLSMRFHSHL
jgi:nicotinate-nucleotide pyrophosphorylase (carboxylating)